jgi:ABC-2 type transport system ATP-binding protein
VTKTVLEARGLTKAFGKKMAVQDVDISMKEGDFLGFLGPNGAGKTTTIKMLTGLIKPYKGDIYYYGINFLHEPLKAKPFIGVVPQQNNVDSDLTAFENLKLHTILYGMDKNINDQIEQMLSFAGLEEYTNKRVKTFSGGMKRRLAIVRALLHKPSILFLDEPTVGLDPQIRRSMWDFILKINQSQKTAIFLTTDNLKKGMGQYVLELYRNERIEEEFFDDRDTALAHLSECDGTCKVREVNLEDVFLKYTGRRINV